MKKIINYLRNLPPNRKNHIVSAITVCVCFIILTLVMVLTPKQIENPVENKTEVTENTNIIESNFSLVSTKSSNISTTTTTTTTTSTTTSTTQTTKKKVNTKPEEKKPQVVTTSSVKKTYYGAFSVTSAERDLLAKTVYGEAGNQSDECMRAVCSVILNRYKAGFASSIKGVIYAKGQFTGKKSKASDRAYNNVDYVLKNGCTLPSYVLYFNSTGGFRWAKVYKKIGSETFCYKSSDTNKYYEEPTKDSTTTTSKIITSTTIESTNPTTTTTTTTLPITTAVTTTSSNVTTTDPTETTTTTTEANIDG